MGVIKHVDVYEDPGGWVWKIMESVDDAEPRAIARGPSFKTKPQALKSLFSIFFGDYDESFLTLYAEFNPDGQFVETQDVGQPVSVPAQEPSLGLFQQQDSAWGDSDPAL
jgi:hypothetical protein